WWRNWIGKKRDFCCKISNETVAGIDISFKEKDIKYLEFLFVYYMDDPLRKGHDRDLFDRLSPNKRRNIINLNSGQLFEILVKDWMCYLMFASREKIPIAVEGFCHQQRAASTIRSKAIAHGPHLFSLLNHLTVPSAIPALLVPVPGHCPRPRAAWRERSAPRSGHRLRSPAVGVGAERIVFGPPCRESMTSDFPANAKRGASFRPPEGRKTRLPAARVLSGHAAVAGLRPGRLRVVDAVLRGGLGHGRAVELPARGQGRERGDRDRLGVDVEVPPHRGPGVGQSEPVGAEA